VRLLGRPLMILGVAVGGAVGLALLFHFSIPGVPWLLALGLAKLTLAASAGLLGAEPGDCVVFEDSRTGIEAARAAGMVVVGLRTTHEELRGVDLEIRDFNSPELEPWLANR